MDASDGPRPSVGGVPNGRIEATPEARAPPPAIDAAAVGKDPSETDRIDSSTWFALLLLGILLFAAGVYLGLGISGAVPSALPHTTWAEVVPFALTISGGVLGMYSYEEWYQSSGGAGGKGRRIRHLKDIPSFEIFDPKEGRRP